MIRSARPGALWRVVNRPSRSDKAVDDVSDPANESGPCCRRARHLLPLLQIFWNFQLQLLRLCLWHDAQLLEYSIVVLNKALLSVLYYQICAGRCGHVCNKPLLSGQIFMAIRVRVWIRRPVREISEQASLVVVRSEPARFLLEAVYLHNEIQYYKLCAPCNKMHDLM